MRLGDRDHVLFLAAHAIVADEASLGLVLEEMASHYDAAVRGEAAPDEGPAVQFTELAFRREQWLRAVEAAAQLRYWTRRLAVHAPALEVPSTGIRPATQSLRCDRLGRRLPGRLLEALRDLARREGVGLYSVLLTGFEAVLLHYTGQEDLVVGMPCSARAGAHERGMVGPLTNPLAIRTDLAGDPTFRESLSRVEQAVREARANADLPFARLVGELVAEPEPGRSPLIQITFAASEQPDDAPRFAGLSSSPFPCGCERSPFDLAVSAVPLDGGLEVSFLYDTDLFDAVAIGRLAGHFEVLLEGAAADPDRRLGSLPLLTEAERRVLVADGDGRPAAGLRRVHEDLADRADRDPAAVALGFEGVEVTYAELDRRANRLAHRLRGLGVGPGSLVGIAMGRSPELVVALLGVFKAGGAYVPLDPALPRDRLAYMIEDARVPVLLTDRGSCESLPACEAAGCRHRRRGPRPRRGTPPSPSPARIWRTSSIPRARPGGPRASR